MGNFLLAVKQPHLADGGQIWRHVSVDAENPLVDDCSQGQEIEKPFPRLRSTAYSPDESN